MKLILISPFTSPKRLFITGLLFCTVSCGGSGGSTEDPELVPTTVPTAIPSGEPSSEPTDEPTPEPSPEPSGEPADATTQLQCGASSGAVQNNQLDSTAKAYLLCKHNETRSQIALGNFMGLNGNFEVATDMKRLQWDNKLESVAQNWANQCQWQHNSNRANEYNALNPTDIDGNAVAGTISVGENLAFFASTGHASASLQYAINGYNAWVNEGQDYSMGQYSVSDYCDNEPCGHFTQVVWANSYKLGCAVNYCAAGTVHSLPSTLLVCNYASAGNYIGQWPYETGNTPDDVCSTADTGQSVCRNGLTQSSGYQTGLP